MAKRIRITVGPRDGTWRITRGTSQPWGQHRTQHLAIAAAAERCRRMRAEGHLLELHIKGRNGRVRDARTYGRDPRGTPG